MELANGKINKFFTLSSEGENRYFVDDFDADDNKCNNNVYILSAYVPPQSIVLDIGCAQGNFGKKLKEKDCIVYGIERDEKAAEHALNSGYYKDIFIFDMTDTQSEESRRFERTLNKVDVLIISDVLEHLENPTEFLRQYSKLLKEDGIILISVPNIAHVDIALNLLNGKFNYSDMGILDNTHMKFFTESSFLEWINQMNEAFEDINFDVEYLGGMFYTNEFIENIKQEYNELFKIVEHVNNYNALQILFKLKKLKANKEPIFSKVLLHEPKYDVVKLLGDTLKGICEQNPQAAQLVLSERMLYDIEIQQKNEHIKYIEKGIEWHRNRENEQQSYIEELKHEVDTRIGRIVELEKGIEWHLEQDKELQSEIQTRSERIVELEKGIEWHQEQDKELQSQIQIRSERIVELEKGIKWHQEQDEEQKQYVDALIDKQESSDKANNLLRRKIFEMENSLSWKITKLLRKR